MTQPLCRLAALMLLAALAAPALAGTFRTITIDDLYTDWDGVPVADSDAVADNFSGPDIATTQIANDNNYLYIRNTFANNLSLGTFVSVDVDQDSTTGFDLFGQGLYGVEAGWQNDFGFAQAAGSFNSGALAGEFFGGGHALLSPFANAASRELALSLANMSSGGVATFPDDTIRLIVWTDVGTGADGLPAGFTGDDGRNWDISGVIEYTLAVPEASTAMLAMFAVCSAALIRRNT
ncbi:MAG TPA: hypothetical protein VF175_14275 [Lacipirellula sp.]